MDITPANYRPLQPTNRVWPPSTTVATLVTLSFTALLYLVEFVDFSVFHERLDAYGIVPRELSGLDGVLWAPLLHASWFHLMANTVPLLVFGFLSMAGGLRQWIAVTATIWVVGGLGVWLTADPRTVTIGASGLAFGWLAFLLARGWFNRNFLQMGLAMVLLFFWGGLLWGLLPGQPGVSWQGHLFGALGGVLAAWLAAKANSSGRPAVRTARPY